VCCSRPVSAKSVSARLLRPIHSSCRITRPWSAKTIRVHAERDSEADVSMLNAGCQSTELNAGCQSTESSQASAHMLLAESTQTQAQTETQAQTPTQTQPEGERRWGEKSSRALTAQSRLTKPLGVCCTCMAVYARIHLCLLHTNTSQVKPFCLTYLCSPLA